MRLSDAGLSRRQTKLIYPNYRPPPWLIEDAPRDRSNRWLDCRAAPPSKLTSNRADELNPERCGSQSANLSIGNRSLKCSRLGRNTAFSSILAVPSRGLDQNRQRPCDPTSLHRALTSATAYREAKRSFDAGAADEIGIHPNQTIKVNLTNS